MVRARAQVLETVAAFASLRRACAVPPGTFGRAGFDKVLEVTQVSTVPHKTKSLMLTLVENWKKRPVADVATKVVISGAGPVGLRAAVEAALMGMQALPPPPPLASPPPARTRAHRALPAQVHVVEKRSEFSRVNILMLWQPTADDLIAYGARTFYPKFTNRHIGTSPLHLGTREIQLVLLKNALLLGVTFSYGTELIGLQAPGPAGASWRAWVREMGSGDTQATGVLDFKPSKAGDYHSATGMGKCNQLQTSEIDPTFAIRGSNPTPPGVETIDFDALLLAEGEWSPTCKRLGVSKSVDRFSQV